MYRYDEFDATLVNERVAQFRHQVERRLEGELSDEEFRALRLRNGVYLQLHAYMLRIAIPYGTLSSRKMRKLAQIARRYDRGYGHFTTRQNLQFHWIKLPDVPDILAELATVEMHCLQTSGNCIRNVSADQYAGVAPDEVEDPRIWSEIIRQWSTLHPEFSFLPRKFKIAVTGSPHDRAAIKLHDIGIVIRREKGLPVFDIFPGGGQGRTPMIAYCIRKGLPRHELLAYLEAIMRTYNELGRRDNLWKSRIKILVHQLTPEKFTEMVEEEYKKIDKDGILRLPDEEIERIKAYFAPPAYKTLSVFSPELEKAKQEDEAFAEWVSTNVAPHKVPGYAIANITLKARGETPGDCSAEQMDSIADLADELSFSEIRNSHEQNLVLPHVEQRALYKLFKALVPLKLATPNLGLASDIICCPGLDYCNLANARSIPIAQALSARLNDRALEKTIGPLRIKMSGCINACGHHHVGHIGILGVEKKGTEYYQISLGGSADERAALGDIVGPAFSEEEVTGAVEKIVDTYLALRKPGETFLEAYRRVGLEPFKERLYAAH